MIHSSFFHKRTEVRCHGASLAMNRRCCASRIPCFIVEALPLLRFKTAESFVELEMVKNWKIEAVTLHESKNRCIGNLLIWHSCIRLNGENIATARTGYFFWTLTANRVPFFGFCLLPQIEEIPGDFIKRISPTPRNKEFTFYNVFAIKIQIQRIYPYVWWV